MISSAVRVNRITTLSQLQGQSRHAMRLDETSQKRLREDAEAGRCLSWSKAVETPPEGVSVDSRDLLAAYKAHKKQTGAGERKGAPLTLQALCVVSPEWIKETGGLHDPKNPRNVALFEAAKAWAEEWAGSGSVIASRLDLDENGGGVVDLCISPVRMSRNKPQISTNKPLQELKAATGERNEFSALQTSWAAYAAKHLDPRIMRGKPKKVTNREHVSPELYGELKDKAYAELMRLAQKHLDDMEQSEKLMKEAHEELSRQRKRFQEERSEVEQQLRYDRAKVAQQLRTAQELSVKAKAILEKLEPLATMLSHDVLAALSSMRKSFLLLLRKTGMIVENKYSDQVSREDRKAYNLAVNFIKGLVEQKELQQEIEEQVEEFSRKDDGPTLS